jgi:hypothetical protein
MARKGNKSGSSSGDTPEKTSVDNRLGGKDERVEIVIERGETFWHLSETKYGGRHPIAAIFQANGLKPEVIYENGLRRLIDPVYFAGNSYVLPAWSEVEELEKQFYELMDQLHPPLENVDENTAYFAENADDKQRSFVTINWDQTLYAVAQRKYGSDIPLEAIYEINQMTPAVTDGPSGKALKEPIYPGGKTYWLPARDEVSVLTDKYRQRVKELMK